MRKNRHFSRDSALGNSQKGGLTLVSASQFKRYMLPKGWWPERQRTARMLDRNRL
jgi:hypothetical protein